MSEKEKNNPNPKDRAELLNSREIRQSILGATYTIYGHKYERDEGKLVEVRKTLKDLNIDTTEYDKTNLPERPTVLEIAEDFMRQVAGTELTELNDTLKDIKNNIQETDKSSGVISTLTELGDPRIIYLKREIETIETILKELNNSIPVSQETLESELDVLKEQLKELQGEQRHE